MTSTLALAFVVIGWALCDLAWAFVPGSPVRPWWHRLFVVLMKAVADL